ncbi:MAG: hypothetical protein DRQ39_06630 [Gammaproteobacteria bacterium]|nr:MAG: hypothetical protein DRQ39_06630 [Gammaproteobacteria bacterium]
MEIINNVNISHGKYVFTNASGSVYVSAVKNGSQISSGFVMPSSMYKERSTHSRYLPARHSGRKELGGFNTGKILEIPNGKLVKVVNNGKRNGRDYINAALLVLVHKNAGMIDIQAKIPADRDSAIGTALSVFYGNGIILSDEDVEALGYDMPRNFKSRYRNQEELEEGFRIEQITDGSFTMNDVSSVKKANGVISIMAKAKPRTRKIIL